MNKPRLGLFVYWFIEIIKVVDDSSQDYDPKSSSLNAAPKKFQHKNE